MSNVRTRWRLGVIAGATVAAVAVGGSPAFADPWDPQAVPPGYTIGRSLNGTGSDTTQDVLNGLAAVVLNADEERLIGSWNATVPTDDAPQGETLHTYAGGTEIPRPNGSGQGLAALRAAVGNTTLTNPRGTSTGGPTGDGRLTRDDLQFARSSSGIAPSTNGTYSYVPFAVDAVTWAKHEDNATIPGSLTLAELAAIYSADDGDTVEIDGVEFEVGNQSNADADIRPFLPQTGSGTRSFWIGQLGLTEAALGDAVEWVYNDGTATVDVQEHDGSVLADVENALVPFSVAQGIAQNKVQANPTHFTAAYPGVTVVNRLHGAELQQIDDVDPVVGGVLNNAFPIRRAVFNVVEYAQIAVNADLEFAFIDDQGTTGATEGAIYKATRPGDADLLVLQDFGFGSLIEFDIVDGQLVETDNGVTIDGIEYRAGDAENFRTF